MSATNRRSKGSPFEDRIKLLKDGLVLQRVAQRGEFWEAIEQIRTYWQIDDPPAQLPPQSEDILLPPSLAEPGDLSELHAMWSKHPLLRPLESGWRRHPDRLKTWRSDWNTAYLNLKGRWHLDLHYVLRRGVPERCLEKRPPHVGNPPLSQHLLPWYRFAAACVLYNPPRNEKLPMFARYGGLPAPPGEGIVGEEPVLGVLTERQLLERAIEAEQQHMLTEMIAKRLWKHRSELDDLDYHQATLEVLRRFDSEMHQELKRLRKEREFEIELDPPNRVYVELEEGATIEERRKTVEAVAAHQKGRPSVGRRSRDQIKAVTAAILKDEQGWTRGAIAELYGWNDETLVSKYLKDGRDFLRGG
jgi:hypothetical protein